MPVTDYDLFGQPANPAALTADPTAYTMGVQFAVTLAAGQTAIAKGVRMFSAAGAAVLPQRILIYGVVSQLAIANEAASWSGAAGSGWVTAQFAAPPALTSGIAYKAAMAQSTQGVNWYASTAHYWLVNGITNGPLSAPNNAGGDGGQDTFNTTIPAYPNTSFNETNYWVDVIAEVTSPAAQIPAAGGGKSMLGRSLLWADL